MPENTMPIGEFGAAPPLAAKAAPALTTRHVLAVRDERTPSLNPVRAVTDATKILYLKNPLQSVVAHRHSARPSPHRRSCSSAPRAATASRTGTCRRHDGQRRARRRRRSRSVWEKPFCRLLHFERKLKSPPLRSSAAARADSGADVRATTRRCCAAPSRPSCRTHDVYITDWADARHGAARGRPVRSRRLYVDYLISILHALGGNIHI
jgi:poly(3-hydroxybutyrate) depolymerase